MNARPSMTQTQNCEQAGGLGVWGQGDDHGEFSTNSPRLLWGRE